jgi:hypothetical protein
MARADAAVGDPSAFWERYEWHWTGGDRPGATGRRARYRQQARDRAGTAAAQVAEVTAEPATAALLAAYQRVLPADGSLFHHVHLTNNRLGIPPTEEGYLARLLTDLRTH